MAGLNVVEGDGGDQVFNQFFLIEKMNDEHSSFINYKRGVGRYRTCNYHELLPPSEP